jgi:nitroimidazol reductase NimA-like FMN-containing flavoprotein (pyridoxamine 5'-phosphate oxidase superfamily)
MGLPAMGEREREAFLAEPHVGVLSVASDDERPPLTVPVWYAYEPGGDLTFFTGTQGRKTRKARLIEQSGVVSFCVQEETFPYKSVTIEGRVIEANRTPSAEAVLAIVRRYLPEEHAQGFAAAELGRPAAESQFVLYTVRPERWLSVDFSGAGG